MEQPPPQPLDYASPHEGPGPGKHGGSGVGKFFLGLAVGVAVSGVAYVAGFGFYPGIFAAVVCGKLIAATILLSSPKWRAAAGGVYLSLPVGALIFFGVCAANFRI